MIVAVGVLHPWVGRVGDGARRVVGEGEVDVAVVRVDRAPLRAIHLGRAEDIGGQAGVDQHFALVGEAHPGLATGRAEVAVGDVQRQPLAAAIGVEAGDVEGAFVEQASVAATRTELVAADVLCRCTRSASRRRSSRLPGGPADQGEDQAFVGEAAESGALDRYRLRVERVDLDDPAEVVRFVAVVVLGLFALAGGVEAFELVARQGFPAETAGVANAVAGQFARQFAVLGGEIADPVLLAGEVGAPGVKPLEQLLWVPRVRVPSGLWRVRSSSWPRAGPAIRIGVAAVIRRFRCDGTTFHSPRTLRRISTTETPWALISLRTSSATVRLPSTTVGPLRAAAARRCIHG